MKSFLYKLAWFLAFATGLSILLTLSVVVLNRTAVNSCDLEENVDTVIAGDSHIMWSIDTSGMDNVRNVALNAEGYPYTYYKLKHILEKNPGIKHVYLGFGYHNLSGYYDDYIVGPKAKFFFHRYIGVMPLGDLAGLMIENPKDVPEIFRSIIQKGGIAAVRQRCLLYGNFPDEHRMESFNPMQMKKRIAEQYYNTDGQVTDISEINLEYLEKIIELVNDKEINVTLLNTPLHSQYESSIPEKYRVLYDSFVRQHQLSIYDFADLQLSDSDFLPDGDHVNYRGAMATTLKFREFLENLP